MLVPLPKPAPLTRVLTQMRLYQASHGMQWPSLRALARAAQVSHTHARRLIKKAVELGLAQPVYNESSSGKQLVSCQVVLDRNVERGLAWAHEITCAWTKPLVFKQQVGVGVWLDRALFSLRHYQGKRTKNDPMPLIGRPDAQVWAVRFASRELEQHCSELNLGPLDIAIVHLVAPADLPKASWCLVDSETKPRCAYVTNTQWGHRVRRTSDPSRKAEPLNLRKHRFVAVIGRIIRVMPMPRRLAE